MIRDRGDRCVRSQAALQSPWTPSVRQRAPDAFLSAYDREITSWLGRAAKARQCDGCLWSGGRCQARPWARARADGQTAVVMHAGTGIGTGRGDWRKMGMGAEKRISQGRQVVVRTTGPNWGELGALARVGQNSSGQPISGRTWAGRCERRPGGSHNAMILLSHRARRAVPPEAGPLREQDRVRG
jgi:hypothetical protein